MEKKQYIAPKVSVTIIEGMTIMAGSGSLNPVNDQGNLGIGTGTETSGWAPSPSKYYDVWADDEEQ